MKKIFCFLVGMVLVLSGCTSYVFKDPMAVSNSSAVYKYVKETDRDVRAVTKNGMFVLIPIVSDPRKAWGEILDEAEKVNCDAVLDVQYRPVPGGFIWMFPPIMWTPTELEGTAAKML